MAMCILAVRISEFYIMLSAWDIFDSGNLSSDSGT